MILNWKTIKNEADLIAQIAGRAFNIAQAAGISYPIQDASMDITAVHLNDCALDLAELLVAEPFEFTHDVFGIRRHLNRSTGKLEDCFLPRFAVRSDNAR